MPEFIVRLHVFNMSFTYLLCKTKHPKTKKSKSLMEVKNCGIVLDREYCCYISLFLNVVESFCKLIKKIVQVLTFPSRVQIPLIFIVWASIQEQLHQ